MVTESQPAVIMQQMLQGFEVSQALFALISVDVPTTLHRAGALPVRELAERTDANADALARMIRSLVPLGVFTVEDGRVGLTELGATLSADNPRSLRGVAMGLKHLHYLPFSDLEYTLRTGRSAATKHYGMPYFTWIAADPARGVLFNDAMVTFMATLREGMLDGYEPPAGDVIADIGGGNGGVLAQLRGSRHGILFDLPAVIDAAPAEIADDDHIALVAGDFFEKVPAADIYVLSWILHDWDDVDAGRILASVAAGGRPGARLLVIESVMPDGDQPHPSKSVDLTMLAILGGRERTEGEYRSVLEAAGFTLDRVVATPGPFSILEATLTFPTA
jgi:hypothetical protein